MKDSVLATKYALEILSYFSKRKCQIDYSTLIHKTLYLIQYGISSDVDTTKLYERNADIKFTTVRWAVYNLRKMPGVLYSGVLKRYSLSDDFVMPDFENRPTRKGRKVGPHFEKGLDVSGKVVVDGVIECLKTCGLQTTQSNCKECKCFSYAKNLAKKMKKTKFNPAEYFPLLYEMYSEASYGFDVWFKRKTRAKYLYGKSECPIPSVQMDARYALMNMPFCFASMTFLAALNDLPEDTGDSLFSFFNWYQEDFGRFRDSKRNIYLGYKYRNCNFELNRLRVLVTFLGMLLQLKPDVMYMYDIYLDGQHGMEMNRMPRYILSRMRGGY